MQKYLIIIPAYNESESIEKLVDNILNLDYEIDYIIINDGSVDDTLDVLKNNNYNYINLPINLGIGGCVQTGYLYAKENDYDIAVQVDGDGQHEVSYIKNLIDSIENDGVDIAIGSRFISKEGFQSSSLRRFGIKILSSTIKIFSGAKIKDVTSGFRAVNKKFIDVYANDYAKDYPEPEAIILASLLGGKIKEVPVKMNERERGVSSISPAKSVYYMIKVTLSLIIYSLSIKREKGKGENK